MFTIFDDEDEKKKKNNSWNMNVKILSYSKMAGISWSMGLKVMKLKCR